ncbi:MAG: enoyl-CoA hydratase-related protein [Acetivibrionales bacterium]|jgi:polyketide biosynthesis enoyl-CoA hydratase PksH
MEYSTILTEKFPGGVKVTINRPAHRNSINEELLLEFNEFLDLIEGDDSCRIVVLQGQDGIFCTGMDFEEVVKEKLETVPVREIPLASLYMKTLKRFSFLSKIFVAKIDGHAVAGGVGLVAASDIAVATSRSEFSLPEALWGILPAMVAPFLVRRIGYQAAYRMALTTLPVSAQTALQTGLVDEVTDTPDSSIRLLCLRMSKIEDATVRHMKRYFRRMWFVNDNMEEEAVRETSRVLSNFVVRENIYNFVNYGIFPWDKSRKNNHLQEGGGYEGHGKIK